jgi:Protein of unknown function (DUF1838)
MSELISRRTLLERGTALAVATAVASTVPRAAMAARRVPIDLTSPVGNVTAYLKLRASTVTQDVYYWFTGTLDLAVAGEPVKPIVRVESLILRRTEKVGDLAWNVIDWEAALYRDLQTGEYLAPDAEILNPHTGRKVRPLHYREGPVRFRFTDREPRIIGSRDVMPNTGKLFAYPWRIVAGDLYMTKSSYIRAPNWLQPVDWPLESSGREIIVAAHSTLKAPLAEIENPRIASAHTDFFYTATSGWLPWMLMGQTPGHVIWAESGRKLMSLDDAPAEQLAMLRRVHPEWFGRPEPWPEFTNMYLQYKAARQPATA